MRRLLAVLQSLWFRLLLPLTITVSVVLAAHATLSFRTTKSDFLSFVETDAARSSTLIKRATHDGMLLNHKEGVQATIARLASGPEIAAIRVYDKEGTIRMSARSEEVGTRIEESSETCVSCHQEEGTRDTAVLERRALARVEGGPEVLRHLSVIVNEPSCSAADCHAHPEDRRVLGVLDLEMSLTPLESAIGKARRQLLWTTLALILINGVVAALFIRRVVHRPILRLYEGTQRIAGGDLVTTVEVPGRHELAWLAEAFNRMARDLAAARREITEWSQHLEEKVVAKTEELGRAQRQVLHMEKMASLGKLCATVAHELNNPLSGVITYARLVRRELANQQIEEGLRAELVRYLTVIEKECSRCGLIVQNLLLFARRTGAQMAWMDVNEVVDRALLLMRHHIEVCGVRLISEPLREDSRIVADGNQLEQALVALLVNAVDAMKGKEPGAGELRVRVTGNADAVLIDVADTGVGIPEETLPQIFEPFFSTKDAENGAGLGLSVVYGIIQRHGGQIEVESKVGVGTVFHLKLPRGTPAKEERSP